MLPYPLFDEFGRLINLRARPHFPRARHVLLSLRMAREDMAMMSTSRRATGSKPLNLVANLSERFDLGMSSETT